MSSWKLTVPCTRAEAEAIEIDAIGVDLDPMPVLLTRERIEDDPDSWQLEAFFDGKPDAATIAAVRALVPSSKAVRAAPERIDDADWVTMSQQGLEPVHAGRFYVHTAGNRGVVPPGAVAFQIEASRAFGTGHHHTTSGCLMQLDGLRQRGERFHNLIDIGTGTGLLAFAAMHLWPLAHATASDIDPASIDVTAENAAINGVRLGRSGGQLALAAAPGLEHPLLIRRAPYDLVIANILAGPLIELAPAIAAALAEGGTLLLAGLLDTQVEAVTRAYRAEGLRLAGRIDNGAWPALRLRKRYRYGRARVSRGRGGIGKAPGFGSW
jgi:ribosomal protein L11 methyltransferase